MDGHQDDLPPAEAARARRRDRDLDAHERAGMKTGLAKQFKQVLDAQVKRAREVEHGGEPRPVERARKNPPTSRRKPRST